MDTCYRCQSAEDLRTCEMCRRPVCRACAPGWPMYAAAITFRVATCRPCALNDAHRSVEEARTSLLTEGIEPGF